MMKAGRERKVRRIQETLDGHRMTFADAARALGVTPPLVWRTAHGLANNRRILRYFLELGVSAGDLDLPEGMLAETGRWRDERKAISGGSLERIAGHQ